jgi:hypothetical protein
MSYATLLHLMPYETLSKTSRHLVISSAEEINQILNPEINLVIWERSLHDSLFEYANLCVEMPEGHRDNLRMNRRPQLPGESLFLEDVDKLQSIFQKLNGNKKIQIGLSRVTTVQCPLFHVDFVPIRLITTYVGIGTEWVEEGDCDRTHLGCGRNDHLVPDTSKIQRVAPGHVCLLKGEAYPGNRGYGAIHRSPTPDKPRLVLRMDCL